MLIYRGEIFFVCLGPIVGRELNDKRRPVVVLSINDINSKPLVATVVPGSSRPATKNFQNQVTVEPSPDNNLRDPTTFQCHQIRAIDHRRFDQPRIGALSWQDLERVEKALMFCLGL